MMLERSTPADWLDCADIAVCDAVQTPESAVAQHHVTVVVIDPSASLQAGWVLDILAEANRVSDAARFSWNVLPLDAFLEAGGQGRPRNLGINVQSHSAVFIGEGAPSLRLNDIDRERLRKSVRPLSLALACGPAVELFASCSLLKDRTAAACRMMSVSLKEKYPETSFQAAPLHWSGTIGTAASGVAIAAAMLECLARLGLAALADEISGRLFIPRPKADWSGLSPRARFGATSSKIARAISFMQQNLENDVQTEAVASHVGSSVRQLERLFKAQLATTPTRFLKRLRLDRARELLDNTRLSVVEIGCATGFESPAHFSKCFKRVFSIAPAKWREGRQRGKATAAMPKDGAMARAA